MNTNKYCIIIVGPTAVGKTALAVQLAQHFSTQIISADSRQCFKELNIGVAKPSAEELQLVNHFFISSHLIHQEVNAAVFEQYALDKIESIFTTNDITVMVGGTGLYLKAFCEGMDEVPAIDPSTRQTVISNYNNNGIEWLKDQIRKNDRDFYVSGEMQNPQRMMRALEVKISTGKSILSFQKQKKKERPFKIVKIGLELSREQLIERINHRVDEMITQGLVDEVRSLLPYKELNALQTVGYKEIFDYIEGASAFDDAVEAIKINTRQYAKRQMTWFKKDKEINWCRPVFEDVLIKLKTVVSI